MSYCKVLASKALWLGAACLAGMLLGGAPSCKAQEVNPAIFTDTGVEDAYPVKKLAPKRGAQVQTASHAAPAASDQTIAHKRKSHHPARRQNVVFTPGK